MSGYSFYIQHDAFPVVTVTDRASIILSIPQVFINARVLSVQAALKEVGYIA